MSLESGRGLPGSSSELMSSRRRDLPNRSVTPSSTCVGSRCLSNPPTFDLTVKEARSIVASVGLEVPCMVHAFRFSYQTMYHLWSFADDIYNWYKGSWGWGLELHISRFCLRDKMVVSSSDWLMALTWRP